MAAYVIAIITVTDPEVYEVYRELAPPTIAQYEGRYIARGGRSEVLEGDLDSPRLVLLEFDSFEQAKEWWASPEYEAIKGYRRRSTTSSLMLVEGLPDS